MRLRFTFGPSGSLARQIASGAPYDVFLSADEARVKELAESGGLVADSVVSYAQGRVALWSKGGKFRSLADLQAASHIAIANPAIAPYGAAARRALERSGLWERLSPKIVYGESVRQALEYAESGNVDVALTAWSLVIHNGGILVPSSLHDPVRQQGGVVKSSKNPQAARAFLRFLVSPEGRRLLAENGFQ
jgi:molybdate transport system substrate-binding protein